MRARAFEHQARMPSIASRVGGAILSGLLLTLAFPPIDQRWFGLVALVPLLLALRTVSRRAGALIGFAFGVSFFGVLLYWISYFGYAAWVGVVLVLAAYSALLGAMAASAARLGLPGRLAGIPLLWIGIELARGRWPVGGFTWGAIGYTQHSGGTMLPLARVGGVEFLGLAVVGVNALIAEVLASRRGRVTTCAAALGLVLVPGLLPLGLAGPPTGTFDIAAVQGNVPRDRFTGLGRRERLGPEDFTIVDNHIRETALLIGGPAPDLIVWPENVFDRDPRSSPDIFRPVVAELARIGSPLLAGAILDAGARFTNTNLLIEPDGQIAQRYDKVHLVPFGEYVPVEFFRKIVPALDRELPTDGIAGTRLVVFHVGSARVGSIICFESTYPELARDSVRRGAQLLVVSTNNTSFGTSPAAREHLAMGQVRAVENGRAVVQAAISGISAVIEPDGHIVQRSGLFRPALLRARLSLTDGQTPYTRYGSAIELAMGLGALAFAAAGFVRRFDGKHGGLRHSPTTMKDGHVAKSSKYFRRSSPVAEEVLGVDNDTPGVSTKGPP